MAARIDREVEEFRQVMEVPSTFEEGFRWSSLFGALFVGVLMVPGAVYMGLLAGQLAIKKTEVKPKERIIRTGLLFTAGLIAGEALTGVIVAFIIISGLNIVLFKFPAILPGFLLWLFIALLVFYIPLREIYAKEK